MDRYDSHELFPLRSWENGLRRWRSAKGGGEGTNCLEIGVRSTSQKIRERQRKGERRKGAKGGGGRWEISTSSITNSCPSIGCRYIQTLPRKGQSLCRPLCRPRAFLLLSLSTTAAAAPPSLLILSRDLASSFYTSFPPQSRFSSVEKGGPHSCADGRCGQDAMVEGENAESG